MEKHKLLMQVYGLDNSDTDEKENQKEILMGNGLIELSECMDKLMSDGTAECVVTMDGNGETKNKGNIGQVNITLKLNHVKYSVISNAKPIQDDDNEMNDSENDFVFDLDSFNNNDGIMINIDRLYSDTKNEWSQSYIHVMNNIFGESITLTHNKAAQLSFKQLLKFEYNINELTKDKALEPFTFQLIDEESRKVITSVQLSIKNLSILNQYDLVLQFNENDTKLALSIWFDLKKHSISKLFLRKPSMKVIELNILQLNGFHHDELYSCYVAITDKETSRSNIVVQPMEVKEHNVKLNENINSYQS